MTANPQVATMFAYSTHTNIPWNIPQYSPKREYLDPIRQVQQREWDKQTKGSKDKKTVTKRGFYMDYALKVAKSIPSSVDHSEAAEWDFSKEKKLSQKNKVNLTLKKYTYLERIEMNQVRHKAPGVSLYSLEKSLKDKETQAAKLSKKKMFIGETHRFYEETEYLSDRVPGVGQHNLAAHKMKLKLNTTDHKFWKEKHEKERTQYMKKESVRPTVGTYNPMNMTISTFDDLARPKKEIKVKCFGSDAKFQYTRPSKKKEELRPAPSAYSTTIQWRGKGSPNKTGWADFVYKPSHSIYH